jgi:hypothetical protein
MTKKQHVRNKPTSEVKTSTIARGDGARGSSRATPLLVQNVVTSAKIVTIPFKDIKGGKLDIDERYQRWRMADQVGYLVSVIKAGGQIVDPIKVAERTDGSWWIIDGQQRYWAAWHCEIGLRAEIRKVTSLEQERAMFNAAHIMKQPTANWKVMSWPNPIGKLLRSLNTREDSALKGMTNHHSAKTAYPIAMVAKGLFVVVTGFTRDLKIEAALQWLDTELLERKTWIEKATLMWSVMVANVFEPASHEGRMRSLPVKALAIVAHKRWKGLGVKSAWPTPTRPQYRRLQKIRWFDHMPDSKAIRVHSMIAEIESIWK